MTEKLAVAKDRDEVKRRSSKAWCIPPREMEETNRALEDAADAVEAGNHNLQHNLEAIRTESLTDPLTGLANRKYFDRSLEHRHRRSARQRRAAVADDVRHRPLQERSTTPTAISPATRCCAWSACR